MTRAKTTSVAAVAQFRQRASARECAANAAVQARALPRAPSLLRLVQVLLKVCHQKLPRYDSNNPARLIGDDGQMSYAHSSEQHVASGYWATFRHGYARGVHVRAEIDRGIGVQVVDNVLDGLYLDNPAL